MTSTDFNRTITELDHVRIFNMLPRRGGHGGGAGR